MSTHEHTSESNICVPVCMHVHVHACVTTTATPVLPTPGYRDNCISGPQVWCRLSRFPALNRLERGRHQSRCTHRRKCTFRASKGAECGEHRSCRRGSGQVYRLCERAACTGRYGERTPRFVAALCDPPSSSSTLCRQASTSTHTGRRRQS